MRRRNHQKSIIAVSLSPSPVQPKSPTPTLPQSRHQQKLFVTMKAVVAVAVTAAVTLTATATLTVTAIPMTVSAKKENIVAMIPPKETTSNTKITTMSTIAALDDGGNQQPSKMSSAAATAATADAAAKSLKLNTQPTTDLQRDIDKNYADASVPTTAAAAAMSRELVSYDQLETCSVETHGCQCVCDSNIDSGDEGGHPSVATSLRIFTWDLMCLRLERHTANFEAETGIRVEIECVSPSDAVGSIPGGAADGGGGSSSSGAIVTRDQFHAEIVSQAKTQTTLYDGYTLGPHLFGDLDLVDGLHDLTQFIRNHDIGYLNRRTSDKDNGNDRPWFDLEWNDIFLFQRENGAVYDRKIVGIPIDGDVHSLYYRKDLFEKYNKSPPATWDEYVELAKFFHGREEPLPGGNSSNLVEISGSCVGTLERTEFWIFLILSSMTQHSGTSQGAFFDQRDGRRMEPLLGQAFVRTLQYMEQQFAYGAENQYNGDFKAVNLQQMNQGKCAMTFMWGDSFTEAAKAPPTSLIAGYLGTAPTPGSKYYLDRDTQQLELCTENVCSCGDHSPLDDGRTTCINSAPYAAYTGWAMSCSNYVSQAQKRACAEFAGYISSPSTSLEDTIPNVTAGAPFIIVDPYRNSHTRLSEWVRSYSLSLVTDSTHLHSIFRNQLTPLDLRMIQT